MTELAAPKALAPAHRKLLEAFIERCKGQARGHADLKDEAVEHLLAARQEHEHEIREAHLRRCADLLELSAALERDEARGLEYPTLEEMERPRTEHYMASPGRWEVEFAVAHDIGAWYESEERSTNPKMVEPTTVRVEPILTLQDDDDPYWTYGLGWDTDIRKVVYFMMYR